ncbi:hypothetical protein [Flavobacterium aciduliphilum]|uniref:Peptidase C25-like protein n=1 Tax=Flavobacterium aciduliphilum TaxID=1101402 RepID=A0A328YIE7_9FLAO|nr:hypothetical protein [Flavobacterium aciduliphilum]RAR73739.1 hypothetical protein CLV55_10358 [Flavobacterium aciduliphilum]
MNFCNHCGADLRQHVRTRFCHNCGNHLEGLENFTHHQESKDNSSEVLRALKGGILNLLIERIDQIKNTLRSAFKTRYSDSWAKEEDELKKVVNLLISELKNGNNSDVLYAIGAFKTFLKVDAYGNFEKISDTNLNSFLNSSNGRAYGHCYTELIRLFNTLENKLSDSSSNQIESYNYENESNNNNDQSNFEILRNQSFNNGYNSYGIIYTNLNALAKRLNCGEEEVESTILNYISQVEEYGHQYILLDAGNNSYSNIDADDGWKSYVELLKDFQNDNSQAEYLFIVGGHDVVPMAIIDNEPRCYQDDLEIDTDMPYSYLKTDNFELLLWNGNIFKESLLLNVGRIPFATDSDIYDLKNYLDRSSNSFLTNVQINNCFGMTALSWKSASEKIIQNANAQKILHTSPQIDINSVDNVYDESAELYYYNLHGSNAPNASQFYGDNGGAVAPKHIAKAVNPNFFITEACYGAKFIDYNKQSSMLNSALNNNTLAFVGSSRVAFGSCSSNISSADIVAKSFIDALFDNINCGMALSKARIDVFDACPDEQYNYGVTSAVEFNLFGDPILKASDSSKSMFRKSSNNTLKNNSIKSKSYTKSKPEIKEIDFKNLEKGILNDVRNLVNNEVLKIRKTVDSYLYQNFNVDKRGLQRVFLIKSKFGEETFNYMYQNQNGNIQTTYSVFTDKRGKIKSILTSK